VVAVLLRYILIAATHLPATGHGANCHDVPLIGASISVTSARRLAVPTCRRTAPQWGCRGGTSRRSPYGLFQHSPPSTVAFVLAFAACAILTMLSETMMPEAYEHGGSWVGVVTTLGFAVAFTIHTLD
jgi:hypothetical protein